MAFRFPPLVLVRQYFARTAKLTIDSHLPPAALSADLRPAAAFVVSPGRRFDRFDILFGDSARATISARELSLILATAPNAEM